MSTFPDGLYQWGGVPVGSGQIPVTYGNYYFVDYDNGADGNSGKRMDKAKKTVLAAYNLTTTNNNDVIVLSANTAHPITEMLTVSKNRVHFVGLDGGGRQTGHGARLVMASTGVATDLATVKVTGVRNSFTNIKIESTSTTTASLYALIDAGEYTCYKNCSFIERGDLATTTAADVVGEGDSTTWINCEFGAATQLTTVARTTLLIDKIVGSTGMLDNNFFNCNFVCYTTSPTQTLVHIKAAGDGQRYAMFRGCLFLNWDLAAGGTALTNAIYAPSGSELYLILDANCIAVGCGKIATSTNNAGVYICAPVPTTTTSGISVNAAAS